MILVLLLIFIWSLGCSMDIRVLGCSISSPWWTIFTFSIVHLSFVHLLINSSLFMLYWKQMKGIINLKILIPILIMVPAISVMFSISAKPTVGLSSIVYCMLGVYMASFKIYKPFQAWFIIIFSFIFTFIFARGVNTPIHIYSYFISYALSRFAGRWIYD